MGRRLREGIGKFEVIRPDPIDWIDEARRDGLIAGDFVPFRWFNKAEKKDDEKVFGFWRSWFVDDRGELRSFFNNVPI